MLSLSHLLTPLLTANGSSRGEESRGDDAVEQPTEATFASLLAGTLRPSISASEAEAPTEVQPDAPLAVEMIAEETAVQHGETAVQHVSPRLPAEPIPDAPLPSPDAPLPSPDVPAPDAVAPANRLSTAVADSRPEDDRPMRLHPTGPTSATMLAQPPLVAESPVVTEEPLSTLGQRDLRGNASPDRLETTPPRSADGGPQLIGSDAQVAESDVSADTLIPPRPTTDAQEADLLSPDADLPEAFSLSGKPAPPSKPTPATPFSPPAPEPNATMAAAQQDTADPVSAPPPSRPEAPENTAATDSNALLNEPMIAAPENEKTGQADEPSPLPGQSEAEATTVDAQTTSDGSDENNSDSDTQTDLGDDAAPLPPPDEAGPEIVTSEGTLPEAERPDSAALVSSDAPDATAADDASAASRTKTPPSLQRTLPVAWLRAMLDQPLRDLTPGAAWQSLQIRLDEGEGTLTIQTRRDDDRIAVAVGFSDGHLRSLASASADRIQAVLQEHFGASVDLSLTSDDAGDAPHHDHTDRPASVAAPRSDAAAPATETATSSPRARLSGGRHEWVG